MTRRLIDMHVHLRSEPDLAADLSFPDKAAFDRYAAALERRLERRGVSRALVHLLDEGLLPYLNTRYRRLTFSLLVDFRKPSAAKTIARACRAGVRGIKLLTYEQDIRARDHAAALRAAKEVQRQGMFLTVCATFGGKKMYANDAVALVSHLLMGGFEAPLIMAHGGGSRVRDAILIMDDAPNVYADTSFTTTYWAGSPVIDELAYLVDRFPGRAFFGSDAPYVAWDKAWADARTLLAKIRPARRRGYLHDDAEVFLGCAGGAA